MEKKLFLLDAFALIYRAYFAFSNNHRINSKGINTSAMFGFTNTLLDVIKKEKPTHIAVVFDTAEPTERHQVFSDYKANRQEMPEDLAKSIPYITQIIEAFNIPIVKLGGYEADDIIGTLAIQAEKNGFTTFMMTPDKDYGQLVDKNTFIYKPGRAGAPPEILGEKEVCERWGISRVEQVKDILGLMGDAVDNIPGIPGVGEKTATQLVQHFDSVENLLDNTHLLKGKLKEKVENNKQAAIQSKMLASIITDVPINIKPEDLKINEWNIEALKSLFFELEFKRLAESFTSNNSNNVSPINTTKTNAIQVSLFEEDPAEVTNPVNYKNIDSTPHHYSILNNETLIQEVIYEINQKKRFCFDTETTSLDTLDAEVVGLSLAIKTGEAYYVPMPESKDDCIKLLSLFKNVFEDDTILKIGQNIKYDIAILKNYDINITGALFDTMIAHFLLQPEARHNMDYMAKTYLNYEPVSIESLIGKKGKTQGNMRDVPMEQIANYAAEDADVTLQLFELFAPKISTSNLERLLHEVELPLVNVLQQMEFEGINLDTKTLQDFSKLLAVDIVTVEKEIQQLAGSIFNVSSPKQVGEVLFEKLKIIDKPQKTKTGQYSTGEDVLSKLENKSPIVRKILDYRELVKLKNTYVDVLPQMVNKKTGRLHTSYNQVVAVTGRLSSDNPNLQNIPIRTARGREIRKAFVAKNESYQLLSADYSQIELRIMASLSKDENMIAAFNSGEDIHAATAAKVYGVQLNEVSSDQRRNAKMVNFGIIYGISAFGLADRLNISRTEAKEIIENYFKQYPGIKDYMDESIANARSKGFVETILGRRRFLRDINSANATVRGFAERNAINAPIQGSAADMIKVAMINIQKEIKKNKLVSKMLLQVHDELVFDCFLQEKDILLSIVSEKMKYAIPLNVPVEIGIGMGNNWLEAH